MTRSEQFPKWLFIVFPALAMMLGWGLRGHIGGGPFGAMIPGAMVALSLGLLLKLPVNAISLLTVFGVVGIGLGGEMTYGQTLGFLRNPETVWWGTAGTTLKGAVWGLSGGSILAIGLFFNHLPKKTIVIVFLIMMAGMILGFKLINDPMILYFSDPANPRPESWAALLFGAVSFLVFLKLKTDKFTFGIISRFAIWGTIGGAFGFGLGGFWMVLGSHLPDVIFNSWWKAMEFTFGLLFGASLGYAGLLSQTELKTVTSETKKLQVNELLPVWKELLIVFLAGLVTYWLIPSSFEPFVESTQNSDSIIMNMLHETGRIVVNYAFYGFLFVLVIIRYQQIAWQIAITLTFCHAAIDLIRDFYPQASTVSPFTMYFFWVFTLTGAFALLTAYFSRNEKTVRNLFLLLIWSCVIVSFSRMAIHSEKLNVENLTVCQIICRRFIVDIFFAISAVVVSWILIEKFKKTEI